MESLPEDQQVIELLSKLKRSNNNGYPADMLAARRQMYVKQAASVGAGLGFGSAFKRGSGSNGAATALSNKVLEIVLVVAISLEAGTIAYLYRDKIVQALGTPTDPAVVVAEQASPNNVNNPALTEDLQVPLTIDGSDTPSPTATPMPGLAGDTTTTVNSSDDNGNSGTSLNANGTPQPTNQGNQYGLTPKPNRTKENNGNSGGNSGGNNGGTNNGNGGNNK